MAPTNPPSIHVVGEKQDYAHNEIAFDEETKQQNLDYSGAKTTLSPEEVKLVRKLDLWIMVRNSSTVGALADDFVANVVVDVLAQLS